MKFRPTAPSARVRLRAAGVGEVLAAFERGAGMQPYMADNIDSSVPTARICALRTRHRPAIGSHTHPPRHKIHSHAIATRDRTVSPV